MNVLEINKKNKIKNIAILDCGVVSSGQRHRATQIKKKLLQINQDNQIEIIRIIDNQQIKNIKNFTHIIITGSDYDYDTNLEGLNYLRLLIPKIKKNKIPTLGICFGAQILTDQLGGKILKQQQKEIGFYEIEIVENNKIFQNISNFPKVFQYHFDHIIQIPKNAQLLAKSKYCNQAFEIENFIGVQFHPEIDFEFAKNEYKIIKDKLMENHQICENKFTSNHCKNHEIGKMFENFLNNF